MPVGLNARQAGRSAPRPYPDVAVLDLRTALSRETSFDDAGRILASWDPSRFDLVGAAVRHAARIAPDVAGAPLETLHERLPLELMTADETGFNALSRERIEGAELVGAYEDFVVHLAIEILGFDVVFERLPPLRFHFPGPLPERFRSRRGASLTHHSDTLFGDCFEQINCWLPLTKCHGSSGLQVLPLAMSRALLERLAERLGWDARAFAEGRREFFAMIDEDEQLEREVLAATSGIDARVGDLVLFDPRLVHGTGENVEPATRVSIDFRVVPLESHERILAAVGGRDGATIVEGEQAVRGDFYHACTAFELARARCIPS